MKPLEWTEAELRAFFKALRKALVSALSLPDINPFHLYVDGAKGIPKGPQANSEILEKTGGLYLTKRLDQVEPDGQHVKGLELPPLRW